jgi:hypothetical protein
VAGSVGTGGAAPEGLAAGAGGAGVGAYPGAGLTSYTRPASTFEPETGGRPTSFRGGVANATEVGSLTTSVGTGGTAMPMAPAGRRARSSGDKSEGAVAYARIVVDGDQIEPR